MFILLKNVLKLLSSNLLCILEEKSFSNKMIQNKIYFKISIDEGVKNIHLNIVVSVYITLLSIKWVHVGGPNLQVKRLRPRKGCQPFRFRLRFSSLRY